MPVPGVQKPPRQVQKQFQDCRVAAPKKDKVKKPAGLKMLVSSDSEHSLPNKFLQNDEFLVDTIVKKFSLRSPAPRPLLLHHQSRVAGRDGHRQLP